jgi:hypothetical protein
MKTSRRKSFLEAIRTIGLALIILVVSTWLIIGVCYEMLGEYIKFKQPDIWLSQYWDIIVLLLYILIISVACFHLVRKNPSSMWFVPFICNAYGIAVAITEPAYFWKNSFGIIFCFGWVFSILTSVIGARIGKSNPISDSH